MTDTVRLLPGSLSEVDALNSKDPITAFIARLSVSNVHVSLVDFFNAEVKRPGASTNDILIGLAAYSMQMHASFAAYLTDETCVETVMRQYQQVFNRIYREHFIDCAKAEDAA